MCNKKIKLLALWAPIGTFIYVFIHFLIVRNLRTIKFASLEYTVFFFHEIIKVIRNSEIHAPNTAWRKHTIILYVILYAQMCRKRIKLI